MKEFKHYLILFVGTVNTPEHPVQFYQEVPPSPVSLQVGGVECMGGTLTVTQKEKGDIFRQVRDCFNCLLGHLATEQFCLQFIITDIKN